MPKPTCLIDGCETPSHRAKRCAAHYARALAAGECGSAAACKWIECELIGTSRGYCSTHYARFKVVGHVEEPWVAWEARIVARAEVQASKRCRWPECASTDLKGQGLCRDHYRQAGLVGDMESPWKLWKPGGHCVVCGEWRDGAIRNMRFCSQACNMLDWKRRNPERVKELGREHQRRRNAQKRSTQVDRFTDKDVRMAHGDICYLCGVLINFKLKFPHPKSPSVDHVIPLARGGSHTLENCVMTHFQCNQIKSAKETIRVPQPTLFFS